MKINYLLLILPLLAMRLSAQDTPPNVSTNKPKAVPVTNATVNAATNLVVQPATNAAASAVDRETLARQLLEKAYVGQTNGTSTAVTPTKVPGPPTFPAVVPGAAVRPATNVVAKPRPGVGATNLAATAKASMLNAATNAAGKSMDEVIQTGLLKLQKADIDQVLEYYAELVGRTVLRPATLPAPPITIKSQTPLTRREAIQALDSVLGLNQITMIPVGEKFVKALPEAQAPQSGKEFYEGSAEDLPEAGQYITQIVQLTVAKPSEVIPAITPLAKLANNIIPIESSMILVLRDYSENIKRMMEIIKKVDVVVPQEYEPVVIPIKYALASDIQQVLASLTPSGAGPSVGRAAGGTGGGVTPGGSRAGAGMGGLGGIGGAQGQINPATGQPYPGGTGAGLGGGATGSRSAFQNRLSSIVNRVASGAAQGDIQVLSQTKIIADERTNSLLIFANKQDLESIRRVIEKLDVVLAQVLIEALIIEVALDKTSEYGLTYLQRQKAFGDNSSGAGFIRNNKLSPPQNNDGSSNPGGIITGAVSNVLSGFGYAAKWGDFDVVATASASDNRIKVLQRPKIQTSHAVQATLFVGETRPYPTTSYYGGGAFGGSTSIQQLQIGVTLNVTPLINPEGLVVMDIDANITDSTSSVDLPNVGPVPITKNREANAKVAVRDRETVVLGGFISNNSSQTKNGVPILMDIPILGALFRSSNKEQARRELMIFVRPTVLPTPESASLAAMAERDRASAVKRADMEDLEYTRKTAEALQKDLDKLPVK